jgi:hypothetical protein
VLTGQTAGTAGIPGRATLLACLLLTVPSWMDRVRSAPVAELGLMTAESAAVLAVRHRDLADADAGPAPAVSHLARLIAIAALSPGGITFCGQHWCATPHPGCPGQPPIPPSPGGTR